ncbi:hypothetical protein [Caenispirillum salinarum]|uniref:hypothetical protein n=1 Tax=Caenispirillum salinarum TaxID=859058 RepID=UPI00384C4027
MKAFLSSLAFVLVSMGLTAIVFEGFAVTATEAHSTSSARVDHESQVDGRLGWSPDLEPDDH